MFRTNNLFEKLKTVFLPGRKNRMEVVLLVTSDIHGAVYPYDYILGRRAEWGLTKIATLVKKYRQKYSRVILLDNGDFLQGSPLNYYYNFIDTKTPYPLCAVMNAMRYSASCVGNHDVEQGPKVYNRIRKQLYFPWLSANALTRKGKSYFQPFTFREFDDLKIAILGLTTPAIPLWLNRSTYPGIHWQDMETAAQGWAKYLKETRGADVLVGLFHAGIHAKADDPEWPKDIPEENPVLKIAENNPEFDVIISGHEHRRYNTHPEDDPERRVKKPLVIMPGYHGRYLGVVHLHLEKIDGKWRVKDKYAHLDMVKGVEADPEILKIYQPYHQRIMQYINSVIGEASQDISSQNARFQDSAFVDLIHRAQLDHTTAQISLAAAFTTRYTIKKGPVRIRDVYGLYPYENKLYVVLMSGSQLKEHLERCSSYFNQIDLQNPFRVPLINHDFMGFNYDMARGVDYEIDITKPPGERIQNLRLSKTGKPLNLRRKFKVAVNSYRAIQLQKTFGCPILWRSQKEMRDILVEYIQKVGKIDNQFTSSWKLVPEELVKKILEKKHSG